MKKYLLFSTPVLLLLAGCAGETGHVEEIRNGADVVEVTMSLSLDGATTKAVSDNDGHASGINHWVMEVRDQDGNLYNRQEESSAAGTKEQKFSVSLVKNNDYSVQFWADTKGAYKTDDLTAISLNAKATKSSVEAYVANQDSLDAFSANVDYTPDMGKAISATLKRPFAQLNIQTVDLEELWTATKGETDRTEYDRFAPDSLSASLSVPTTFNVKTQKADDTVMIELYAPESYKAYETDSVTLKEHHNFYNHSNPATFLMGYLFAGTEKALYDISFGFKTNGRVVSQSFTAIPLQKNYRTNIKGKLLTDKTEWTVTIDPDWTGEYDEEKDN